MEQQVNLFQPIMGAEKRLFSARAIGVGLCLLGVCLGTLEGFGAWRTARIEHAVALIEGEQASQIAMNERAHAMQRPARSLAELDAQALDLSADIAGRQRALDVVRLGAATPATGFAARLESLGRRELAGLWLRGIVLGSGGGRLAMKGAAVDARLIPAYLAALGTEPAFDGVELDTLAMRSARPDEAPAQMVFEVRAPGLKFSEPEKGR